MRKIKHFMYQRAALILFLIVMLLINYASLNAQVQLKHIIDFSESGEIIFFNELKQNNYGINLSPNLQGQRLSFFISNGAENQKITFRIKKSNFIFNPAYSCDGMKWHTITEIKEKDGYYYFSFLAPENSVEVSLNQQSRQIPALKNVETVTYYPYERYESYLADIIESPWLTMDTIGASVENRDIFLLTITNFEIPDSLKKTVWINYRVHCDEHEQSYIMEGMIDYLISADTCANANDILSRTIYKIVPLINVDGVFHKIFRYNVNGVDMNRCWSSTTDYSDEEPEIQGVHGAMDDWMINKENKVSFALDMHGWGLNNDGGYKSTSTMTTSYYVLDQSTFINKLVKEDEWQQLNNWTYSEGSPGMSRLQLYAQHQLNILTSETTGDKRYTGAATTIESLYNQGPDFCRAIDNYLFHIHFVNLDNVPCTKYNISDEILIELDDLDERYGSAINVSIVSTSGDSETVSLTETGPGTGIFKNSTGLSFATGTPTPGDNLLQVKDNDTIKVYYEDNDFPDDNCTAYAVINDNTGIEEFPDMKKSVLKQNFPNPFTHQTSISFAISETSTVQLEVFNISGQKVKTLVNQKLTPGKHTLYWNGCNENGNPMPSGVYYYRLKSDNKVETKQMVLIK